MGSEVESRVMWLLAAFLWYVIKHFITVPIVHFLLFSFSIYWIIHLFLASFSYWWNLEHNFKCQGKFHSDYFRFIKNIGWIGIFAGVFFALRSLHIFSFSHFFEFSSGPILSSCCPFPRQCCFMETTGSHLHLPCFVVSFCQPSILPSLHMALNPAGFIQIQALPASKTDMPPVTVGLCEWRFHPPLRWQLEGCHPHSWCFPATISHFCSVPLLSWDVMLLQNYYVPDRVNFTCTISCIQPYKVGTVLLFRL